MFKLWCCADKEKELETCLQLQDDKKVRKLLSRGANPNEYSENPKCSFLSMAITQRNETLVRMMLKAGASTNQTTWPSQDDQSPSEEYPLHVAVQQGHLGIVKALLEHGANVNIGQDSKIGTPLHLATKQGHKDVTSLLLINGADIIAIDRLLDTPLHKAATYGYTSVVNVLLNKGAPVNAGNYSCATPLHHAARAGANGVVKMLLERGADPSLTDSSGRTPLEVCEDQEIRVVLSGCQTKVEFRETEIGIISRDGNGNAVHAKAQDNTSLDPVEIQIELEGALDQSKSNGISGTPQHRASMKRTTSVEPDDIVLHTITEHPNTAPTSPATPENGVIPRMRYAKNGENASEERWRSFHEQKEDEKPKYWEERRGRSLHQPRVKRKTSRGRHPVFRTQSDRLPVQ